MKIEMKNKPHISILLIHSHRSYRILKSKETERTYK